RSPVGGGGRRSRARRLTGSRAGGAAVRRRRDRRRARRDLPRCGRRLAAGGVAGDGGAGRMSAVQEAPAAVRSRGTSARRDRFLARRLGLITFALAISGSTTLLFNV